MTHMEDAGARGEGLEPSITGPEPVVLPITPPPNGWAVRLAERPVAGVRPADRAGGALNRGVPGGKMHRPGLPGSGFGGPRHASVVRSACRPGRGGRRGRACAAGPGRHVRPLRQGDPQPGSQDGRDGHRERPWPPEVLRGQAPDLVRDRVHGRRPRAGWTRARTPPTATSRTPRPCVSAPRAHSAPTTASRPASSATATAGRSGMPPASSAWGPLRVWDRRADHLQDDAAARRHDPTSTSTG